MTIYKPVKQILNCEYIGTYTAYGVSAIDTATNKEVAFMSDVFLDEKSAENFTCVCNKNKLDVIHLADVIDDFLCGENVTNNHNYIIQHKF